MQLYRYPCGCIGLPPFEVKEENGMTMGSAYILHSCDGEDSETCHEREVHLRQDGPGKYTRSMELMSLEESKEILDRLYALIIDGQSLRQIRHLLKE